MHPFQRPSTRTAIITGAAGVAVVGAVALGGAAFAAGPSAMPVPSGTSSSAPAAPAAPGAGGPAAQGQAPAPKEHKPHIGGDVLTVSASTVTVKDHDGFTRTIQLGSGATVTKDGSTSDASAIVKGQHIEATGTVDSNGTTLDATEVMVGQPTPPNGGPGKGGPGHGGPGRGGPAAPAPQQGEGGTQQGQAPTPPSGAPSAPAAPSTQPSAPTTGS